MLTWEVILNQARLAQSVERVTLNNQPCTVGDSDLKVASSSLALGFFLLLVLPRPNPFAPSQPAPPRDACMYLICSHLVTITSFTFPSHSFSSPNEEAFWEAAQYQSSGQSATQVLMLYAVWRAVLGRRCDKGVGLHSRMAALVSCVQERTER